MSEGVTPRKGQVPALLNTGVSNSPLIPSPGRVMYSQCCLWGQFSLGSPGEARWGSAEFSAASLSWTPVQPVPSAQSCHLVSFDSWQALGSWDPRWTLLTLRPLEIKVT